MLVTIKIKEPLLAKIDDTAKDINCSRNELINIILEHGIENVEIV